MRYVLWPNEATDPEVAGGKAAALAQLAPARLPVPGWFVLRPEAFRAAFDDDAWRTFTAAHDRAVRTSLLNELSWPVDIEGELHEAIERLGDQTTEFAVRSSGVDEDSTGHSFAGQFESYLHVSAADVAARIVDVWRSGFSGRLMEYRREHGLEGPPTAPAVLVQRMINADAAGVAFSADPVHGRRAVAIISAVRGTAEALVQGDVDGDTYAVDRQDRIIERAHVGGQSVLNDDQITRIAALARRAAEHFNRPQDIEWALEDRCEGAEARWHEGAQQSERNEAGSSLWLLQSRPITSLHRLPDPEGQQLIWDNSNIAESYSGITTPLTFSFARRAYEEVYGQFCALMGVPHAVIAENDEVFRNMLGMVRGRVYYNLLNWYRLLAMLPGFRVNRRFMEQMMGVREGLPDSLVKELGQTGTRQRFGDALRLGRSIGGLLFNAARLPRLIRQFENRLQHALAPPDPRLEDRRADELVAHYRELESQLLRRWDAPIVNDFFAMIFYGLLRTLSRSWCGDEAGTIQNDLISGEGGMISAEPALRLRELAKLVRPHESLSQTMMEGNVAEIIAALEAHPQIRQRCDEYLERFGDRCLEELKLESHTLHDEPLMFYRAIGRLAQHAEQKREQSSETSLRSQAEQRVADSLRGRPIRRMFYRFVLRQARNRVRDRENLRFERTRVFGRVRRVMLELGRRYMAEGVLDDARDVFYLEVEEALGYGSATVTTTDLAALAAVRRREFEKWRDAPEPVARFETRGMVFIGNVFEDRASSTDQLDADGDQRSGIGCCPGVVEGPVRVVTDPARAELHPGEILIAERTDPGWVMLFPAASGLLVERGSLLSHSAIVAREMGIPAIVSIPGVTKWLRTGDHVRFDGASGIVTRLHEAEHPAEDTTTTHER